MGEVIQQLNSLRDEAGGQIIRIVNLGRNDAAADVHLFLRDEPTSRYGLFACRAGYETIWFNSNLDHINSFVWQVAHHELGHAIGGEHSGRFDSYYGLGEGHQQPTRMATCMSRTEFQNNRFMTNDERAYYNLMHGSHLDSVGSWRRMMADSGFENGLTNEWIFWNGMPWALGSGSDAWDGNRWLSIRPTMSSTSNSSTHFVQQNIFVHNGTGAAQADESYRGSARVREWIPEASTQVSLEVWRRLVDFPGNNGCRYELGMEAYDPNAPDADVVDPWQRMDIEPASPPSGTYGRVRTTSFTLLERDGADLAVRLRGTSILNGSHRWFLVDNLSMEGTT